MPTVEQHFRSLLQAGQFSWLPSDLSTAATPHALEAQLSAVCTLHAPGMLSERRQLSDLVLYLDSSYQAEYERAGEIDEREFLTTDFGALASPRTMLGGAAAPAPGAGAAAGATPAGTPSSHAGGFAVPSPAMASGAAQGLMAKPPLAPSAGLRRPLALGLQSPLPIMHLGPPAPATPITQAMGSVSWLRGVTKDCGADPSAALQQLLASAGKDAGAVLVARVHASADAVFGAPGGEGGEQGKLAGGAGPAGWAVPSLHAHVARERREEALKLYWLVLEAMLVAEQARAGPAGAGALATRWSFHSCLLALSFEMVAASYRMGALCFPAIPEKLGLRPFDLTKIIPAFVRALPSMPRELKRHLFTVEEKVVESLGWQASSSLYTALVAAVGRRGASKDQQKQQQGEEKVAAEQQQQQDADSKAAVPMDTSRHEEAAVVPQQAQEAPAGEDQQQQQPPAPGGPQQSEPQAAADKAAVPMEADSGSASPPGSQPGPSASWSPSTTADGATGTRASSVEQPSSKRQRGGDGEPVARGGEGRGEERVPGEGPLPQALGQPPEAGGVAPAGSDPAARAVVCDFCRKVLKLAAFRLVAIRCAAGLWLPWALAWDGNGSSSAISSSIIPCLRCFSRRCT